MTTQFKLITLFSFILSLSIQFTQAQEEKEENKNPYEFTEVHTVKYHANGKGFKYLFKLKFSDNLKKLFFGMVTPYPITP